MSRFFKRIDSSIHELRTLSHTLNPFQFVNMLCKAVQHEGSKWYKRLWDDQKNGLPLMYPTPYGGRLIWEAIQ